MKSILAYLKTHWMMISVVAGSFLIVVSAVVVVFALGARRDRPSSPSENGTNAVPAIPAARTYTDLYAVSIDYHRDARPPAGVNEAAFVYELPVEGGITRFLAVFERGLNVPEIGPVRSARLYFLDIVSELGPSLFLHFGGSPGALSKIASTPSLLEADRDGISSAGSYYWRDEKRPAPHNVFISSANADSMFGSREGAARAVTPWLMAADPDPSLRGEAASFIVPMSKEPEFQPEWHYEPAKNAYVRHVSGKPENDKAGKPIEAKNVIVMETTSQVIDREGRLDVQMQGSGKAVVHRNGQVIEGQWRNDINGAPVRFYGPDGAEIVLTSGNVWIEVKGI